MSVPVHKSPFDKGGFRGNVNTDSRNKGEPKLSFISVNPPGLEPGTPTLKVLCSTC